jgi:chemotaxis protein MotB
VNHRVALALSLLVSQAALACGYSEEEWQAQLEKYNQLNATHEQEKQAHAATRAELDKVQAQVAILTDQLRKMGFNVEQLAKQLEAEGTEKQKLAASLEEMQRALEEYKQRAAQLEKIKKRFEVLRDKLQKLTTLGLKVHVRHNRMVISLPGDVLFASGSDKLRDEGVSVLGAVAEVIRKDDQLRKRFFQIAGHTDNKPLLGGRFKDNWGLSAMRAREVLVYLVGSTEAKEGGGGLDPTRLHAAGYGETDPIADNGTDTGRQANRRVEFVLMPDVEEMLDLRSLI